MTFHISCKTSLNGLLCIRGDRAVPGGHFFEAAEPRAAAAIASGLLYVKTVCANPDDAFAERQMLRHRCINVEALSALVIGLGVFGVDVIADVGGSLETVPLAEITNQQPRFECQEAEALVSQPVCLKLARRRVDAAEKIHMEIFVQRAPTQRHWPELDVAEAIRQVAPLYRADA